MRIDCRRLAGQTLLMLAVLLCHPLAPSLVHAERLLAFVPQPATAAPSSNDAAEPLTARFAMGDREATTADQRQWTAYYDAWQTHARNPADPVIRQRLRLPEQAAVQVQVSDGWPAARSFGSAVPVPWQQPLLVETDHFWLVADLPQDQVVELAEDLERFHAVWTQLFFPLWSERRNWDGSVRASVRRNLPRRGGPPADKRCVIALGSRQQYSAALRNESAAIDQSVGYYAAPKRITYLLHESDAADPVVAAAEARATRYHELTHQLLAEATDSRLRMLPGERSGFWLAEGIACFMESTEIGQAMATVGGWESSRLQFARHHVLGMGSEVALPALRRLGREAFQRQADLSALYALAAADVHATVDITSGHGWDVVLNQLIDLYAIRNAAPLPAVDPSRDLPADLPSYLRLDSARLTPLRRNDLINLCLANCALSAEDLQRIVPQQQLRWLELTGLPLQTADVLRLLPSAASLHQLNLEATAVDDALGEWIRSAEQLRELDLSWTAIGDRTIAAIPADVPLQTLWLTGTRVSDTAIDAIAARKTLRQVDLQQTAVTEPGIERLKTLRPDLSVNPLQLLLR